MFPFSDPTLLDDFNRADSGTLGGDWVESALAWASGAITLTSNQLGSGDVSGANTAAYNTGVSGIRLCSAVTLTDATADDTDAYGLFFRQTGTNDGYSVNVNPSTAPDQITINRYTGATPTAILNAYSTGITIATGDHIAATIEDFSDQVVITFWHRTSAGVWRQIAAVIDVTSRKSGPYYAGVMLGDDAVRMDDFGVESGSTWNWPCPYFVAAGTAAASQTDAASIAPAYPTGARFGDVAFIHAFTNGDNIPTISADWTEETAYAQNHASISTKLWWRRATALDLVASVTDGGATALSATNGMLARTYLFRNCIPTGTPYEDPTAAGNTGTETTPDTSAIDTTAAARLAVSFNAYDDDSVWNTPPPPADWGSPVADGTTTLGGDLRTTMITKVVESASTVAAAVFGTSSAARSWRSLTLALIPFEVPSTPVIAKGNHQSANNTGITFVLPTPWVPETGDIILLMIGARGTASTGFTAPAGYNTVRNSNDTSAGRQVAVFWRAWESGDGNPTVGYVGGGSGNTVTGQCCVIRGADPADLVDAISDDTTNDIGDGTSYWTAANMGPIAGVAVPADGLVFVVGSKGDDFSDVAVLSGDSLTWEKIGQPADTVGNDGGSAWGYAVHSAGGTITAKTFTVTGGGSSAGVGFSFALNPSAAGAVYTDSATVSVLIDVSAVEISEGVDAATVVMALTPSGIDEAFFTDAITIPMAITISAVETTQLVDAATATIVLTPEGTDVYATTIPVAIVGTIEASITTLQPTAPAGFQADDILCLLVETEQGEAVTLSDAQGFVEGPQSPQAVVQGGGTRGTWFWKRAVGSDTMPTIADAGDHVLSLMWAVRGCPTSGNPWDDVAGISDEGDFDTSGSVPGVTTLGNNRLVIVAVTDHGDTASARYSAPTNANLSNIQELADGGTALGAGGGIGLFSGEMGSAGAIGATTYTIGLTAWKSGYCIAFKPIGAGVETTDTGTPVILITASATEARISEDTTTVLVDLQAIALEERQLYDTDIALIDLQATATETQEGVDSGTVLVSLQHTGTDERQRYDADTVYVELDHSGTDTAQLVDAATIYVEFDASALEERQLYDTATAYVDLQTSATEAQESADAATAYVDLDTSAFEERQVYDADTVLIALNPSAADTAQYVDGLPPVGVLIGVAGSDVYEAIEVATATILLVPSSTDVYAALDADTIYVDITHSGTDELSGAFTDSATVLVYLDHTGTDTAQTVDGALPILVALQASALEERQVYDTDTAYVDLQVAATESAVGVDSHTATIIITPSAVDEISGATEDAATIYVDLTVPGVTNWLENGGLEVNANGWGMAGSTVTRVNTQAFVGSWSFEAITNGTATRQGMTATPAAEHCAVDEDWVISIYFKAPIDEGIRLIMQERQANGTFIQEFNGTLVTATGDWQRIEYARTLTNSNVGRISIKLVHEQQPAITFYGDAAQVERGQFATGYIATNGAIATSQITDVATFVDAAAAVVNITPSAVDEQTTVGEDVATVYVDIAASATEGLTTTDATEVLVAISVETVEIITTIDAATVLVDIQTSVVEERQVYDAGTTYVDLNTSAVEAAQLVDAAQAYVDIQHSGTDEYSAPTSSTDFAEVLVDLAHTGTDTLQTVDGALEAYVDILPSSSSITDLLDADTALVDIGTSAVDIWQALDTQEVRLQLSPVGFDIWEPVETGLAYVDINATAVEFAAYIEAQLATVILTPTGTDLFIQQGETLADAYIRLAPSATDHVEVYDTDLTAHMSRRWHVDAQPKRFAAIGMAKRFHADMQPKRFQAIGPYTRYDV